MLITLCHAACFISVNCLLIDFTVITGIYKSSALSSFIPENTLLLFPVNHTFLELHTLSLFLILSESIMHAQL